MSRGANVFKAWKDATSREAKKKSKQARAQTAAAKQVAALQKDPRTNKQVLSELGTKKANLTPAMPGKGRPAIPGKRRPSHHPPAMT